MHYKLNLFRPLLVLTNRRLFADKEQNVRPVRIIVLFPEEAYRMVNNESSLCTCKQQAKRKPTL